MSTRSFSYLIRPVLVGALCTVLATGVLAGVKDSKRPDSDGYKGASEKRAADVRGRQSDKTDSRDQKVAREYEVAGRQQDRSQDRDQSRYQDRDQARRDYGDKSSRPSSDYRRPAPDSSYRRDHRSDQGYQQPYETSGKHDENYRRYPERSSAHSSNPPRQPRVEITINQPRVYAPPVYRGGYYYYSSRPASQRYHYGHWVFGDYEASACRRSVYFHYGYFPYISSIRVHILPYVTVSYYPRPVAMGSGSGYYLADRSDADLDSALSDIRSAWLDGRFDLIQKRVNNSQSIAVLLDGHYDYSLDADDYSQMTYDALDQIETISFTWESVRQRTDGGYTAFGKHTYNDASGDRKTVYVSYTLRKMGLRYAITEVGSSASPLI